MRTGSARAGPSCRPGRPEPELKPSRLGLTGLLAVPVLAGCGGENPVAHVGVGHAGTALAGRGGPFAAPADPAAVATCAACHAEISGAWSRTGMARALGPVQASELAGLTGATVEDPAGYAYRFELGPGAGPDGAAQRPLVVETCASVPEHRLEAELSYAIGAGELDRAFVAVIGGRESFAPLEVVTDPDRPAGGRHLALSPAHAAQPGLRFGLGITPECLGCHTDRLPPPEFPLDLARPESWQPRGISCAACHGDVETHARIREGDAGLELDPRDDPVLRPAQLGRIERMSLCSACHLQGDVRIALDGRLGPPEPGGDLLERMAIFVAREPTEDVGFVSHTERLVLSRCYLEDPRLACDTCHDPHRSLFGDRFEHGPEAAERARVRAACTACHPGGEPAVGEPRRSSAGASACSRDASERAEGRDCVDCHMRRTPTFDVAEVLIHDHFIRRRPGPASPPSPPRSLESPAADWKRFAWPDRPLPGHGDDPGLLMMALASRGQLARALEQVDRPVHGAVSALASYHESRARLLERVGRTGEALAAYERALALDPGLASAAINRGLLFGLAVDRARGIELLSQVLAVHPRAEKALRNRAGLRFELGDREGFQADLEAAFAARPDPELAGLLSDWFGSLGDAPGAAARSSLWKARAQTLDPLGTAVIPD